MGAAVFTVGAGGGSGGNGCHMLVRVLVRDEVGGRDLEHDEGLSDKSSCTIAGTLLVNKSLYVDHCADLQQGEIRLALVEDGAVFFLACVIDWFWKLYVVTSTVSVMGAAWMPRTSWLVSMSRA